MYQHGGDIYSNKNMIDFSANINFMGMPDSVQEAAKAAVDRSVCYPDVNCRELKEAIARKEQVSAEHIFCGNGAADVIFSLVLAKKPKRALLPIPSFYGYQQALASLQCRITPYQMEEKDGFTIREDIVNLITPDIDILFLCNPNNPTGVLTSPELIEEMMHKCERTGTLLVIDECFMELTKEPEKYSMMSWIERSDQIFIIKAFTKTYAMPGLRLGYGICSNGGLLESMERVSQPWRVSVPAQAAGIAAVAETDYLEESRKKIQEYKDILISRIREMGYEILDSSANFIFFEGEYHLGNLLKERGILIRDCSNFQGLHMGYYRIAVRSAAENAKLLAALEEIHLG